MEPRLRASTEQYGILLEYMERNGDIARPEPGLQGRIKAENMWKDLVEILNSVSGGVTRETEKWKKVWTDWKSKTKKKAFNMKTHASSNGGGPSSKRLLTKYEERVLATMGLPAVAGHAEIEERGISEYDNQHLSDEDNTSVTLSSTTLAKQSRITHVDIKTEPIETPYKRRRISKDEFITSELDDDNNDNSDYNDDGGDEDDIEVEKREETEKWEVIGKAIGLQLRDLAKKQRSIAHKMINDVIYCAENGMLSTETSISIS